MKSFRDAPAVRTGAGLEILLATRNSSPYLPQLLDSLLAQSHGDFTVLAGDDGSSDSTRDILAEYQVRDPRLKVLAFAAPAGSARANFARLIDAASADLVMFCDHDDVWKPDKVARSLAAMDQLRAQHGNTVPLLVHTDLVVAGPQLQPRHASYWRFAGVTPARNNFHQLLVQNVVTGCTVLVNRALIEKAKPIPDGAIMHDYWCALVASAFGAIAPIPDRTVLYRQHDANAMGAKGWSSAGYIANLALTMLIRARHLTFTAKEFSQTARHLRALSRQAEAFLARYQGVMTPAQRDCAGALAGLWSLPAEERFWNLAWRGMTMNAWPRNLGLRMSLRDRDPSEPS